MTITLHNFDDRGSKICLRGPRYKYYGICERGKVPGHAISDPALVLDSSAISPSASVEGPQ
jgi:hypothetical protein